jgi:S1-C subfamily serine protease
MTTPHPFAAFSDGLADAVERAAAGIVTVYGRRRLPATGIVWDTDTILTASHVVERDDDLTIGLPDGSRVPATLRGRDHGSDLAVLTADLGGLAALPRATDPLRVGNLALAVGRGDGVRATLGAVSTVGGAWRTINGTEVGGYLRAELTMLPGFSGGPLVTVAGELAGLNTSALGPDGGIAIPVAAIDPIAADLVAHGRLRRGYLGLASRGVELPQSVREAHGGQERGLLIVHVEPEGPAATAGLLLGDVLLTIDGTAVSDADSLQAQLGPDTVDREVTARVLRGGTVTDITVTVGVRP